MLFKKFKRNRKTFDLTESEFRSILMCTLETPKPVVKGALHQLEELLKRNGKKEVLEFVVFLRKEERISMSLGEEEDLEIDRSIVNQLAEATIQSPIHALVELITNSDDSYRRMEEEDEEASGLIQVYILTDRANEIRQIEVKDEATGMDRLELKKALKFGEPPRLESYRKIRALFGRRLKEVCIVFGLGKILTVKNEILDLAYVGEKEEGKPFKQF